MSNKLALMGGKPLLKKKLQIYKSMSIDEKKAVSKVIDSNCLSGFYGSWQDGFLGGPQIQEFEEKWSEKFNSKFSISVNSNTSGLYASVGAVGTSPGDEFIVPCTTMSASAMAPLIYGAIPVFADIDKDTFCVDIGSVKKLINEKTKGIIAVNLFGHPAELKKLKRLADENNIYLIEDNAQAPLASENKKFTGTIGHIGVFSLNYHKHIHTGEGGVCVTDIEELATKLRMIRNHGEAVVGPAKINDLTNMIGFNYRMTELSAAVGLIQLKNVEKHVLKRKIFAEKLSKMISKIPGIKTPLVKENCNHVYYNLALKYSQDKFGVSRETFVKALVAEGFPCSEGYVEPLYMLPIFKSKQAFGKENYPFNLTKRSYEYNMCPQAQKLYEKELIIMQTCSYEIDDNIIQNFGDIFFKVYENIEELKTYELSLKKN